MMHFVRSTGLDQRNTTLEWDTFAKEMLNPKGLFNRLRFLRRFDQSFLLFFSKSIFSYVKTINQFQIKF